MYTLYYSPGSCSLIINCLLQEMNIPFELRKVDVEAREHEGAEYRKLNPKGKVPVLVTPDGALTECVALIEYLCDKHDGAFLGKPGSWERAKTQERIATLATEVHPWAGRFFHEDDYATSAEARAEVKSRGAEKVLEWFRAEDARLTGTYWSGDTLTAADFYFMVVARWGRWLEPSALDMPNIRRFFTEMIERPAVARAMANEGIKPFGR